MYLLYFRFQILNFKRVNDFELFEILNSQVFICNKLFIIQNLWKQI